MKFEVEFDESSDPRFYAFENLTFYDKNNESANDKAAGHIVLEGAIGPRVVGTWKLVK